MKNIIFLIFQILLEILILFIYCKNLISQNLPLSRLLIS